MVRIMVVEATQKDLFFICFAVAICVGQQFQVGTLRNVHTFFGNFKAQRQMQAIRENTLLVGLAVVIGIFKNDDFVGRLRVARLLKRIARHGGYPEAPFVVERHLHGFRQIGKLLL